MPDFTGRFLFTVWPFSGHVHPCIGVARKLAARGHEVAFYTGALDPDPVRVEGFPRFPFRRLAAHTARLVGSENLCDHPALYAGLTRKYTSIADRNPVRRLRKIGRMYREMLIGGVPGQVEDLEAVLGEWKPDVVVTDPYMWGPILVLHGRQTLPVAVFSFFAGCLLPGPGAPPPGMGLPPPRTAATRAIAAAATRVNRVLTHPLRRRIDDLRRQFGLPPLRCGFLEYSGTVPLYMVASAPEFDYMRRDLPPSVRYVGPCLYDGPAGPRSPALVEALESGLPLVYATEGTCQVRKPAVLRAAVEGLGGLPVRVILTTGRLRDPAGLGLGPLPPNVSVERWVSHAELFQHTRVVITNGGSNTVRAALDAGVPLVIVPMEWDQLENGGRVVETGVGLRLSPRRISASTLRSAVQRILNEPSFAANAARIATAFARYDGGNHAVDALEKLRTSAPAVS
ncbi:MAG: glycosyltransferase [Bryobacteraceae bacterium]